MELYFAKYFQMPHLLGLEREATPYNLLCLHTNGELVWPYWGRTLVHLGVNQVLGFLHLSKLFLNCMFCVVKIWILLFAILFWNSDCIDCTVRFPQTVVVSQFYIQPRAGFYLWPRSEPIIYPAQTVLYWRAIGVTGLPGVCGQFSRQEWTVLWTKTLQEIEGVWARRDRSHWSCLESQTSLKIGIVCT